MSNQERLELAEKVTKRINGNRKVGESDKRQQEIEKLLNRQEV